MRRLAPDLDLAELLDIDAEIAEAEGWMLPEDYASFKATGMRG